MKDYTIEIKDNIFLTQRDYNTGHILNEVNEYLLERDRRHNPGNPYIACYECKHYSCDHCGDSYETWELYEDDCR